MRARLGVQRIRAELGDLLGHQKKVDPEDCAAVCHHRLSRADGGKFPVSQVSEIRAYDLLGCDQLLPSVRRTCFDSFMNWTCATSISWSGMRRSSLYGLPAPVGVLAPTQRAPIDGLNLPPQDGALASFGHSGA